MRRFLQIAFALLIAWSISAQPGMADGRDRGFGRARGRARIEARDRDDDRVVLRRDRRIVFSGFTTRSGRPPGWDRGRKTGWGDCDVPPGQAKKHGCNGVVVRGHDRSRHRSVILLPIW